MEYAANDPDFATACAALEWMIEMGVDTPVLDEPVNFYDLPESVTPVRVAPVAAPVKPVLQAVRSDPVESVRAIAAKANTLDDLRDAIAAFDGCDLKKGAKNTIFADGLATSRVMIVGDCPARDDDASGKPFMGREGALLDRMFAAIGLSRSAPDPEGGFYATYVMPWRTPGFREPSGDEVDLMVPFVSRHIALADPDVIVVMGGVACGALLDGSVSQLRGKWTEVFGKPVLPMRPPAQLLRNPSYKRDAWNDLLALRSWLNDHA